MPCDIRVLECRRERCIRRSSGQRDSRTSCSRSFRKDLTSRKNLQVLDLRNEGSTLPSLLGHSDTPTSLALSPNGNFLLSPSLSSQTIIHDIRPFSPSPSRVHRVLMGAPAGFENTLLRGAWSRDDGGKRVGVGGADRTVCIWDVESGGVQYKLPGHRGTVTSVDFHPKEPISESALVGYPTRVLTWLDSFDGKQRRDHAPRRDRAELDGVGPCICICSRRLFVKRSLCPFSIA